MFLSTTRSADCLRAYPHHTNSFFPNNMVMLGFKNLHNSHQTPPSFFFTGQTKQKCTEHIKKTYAILPICHIFLNSTQFHNSFSITII